MDYRKKAAYLELVRNVKKCGLLDECNSNSKIPLEKCPQCNEINLWSYWQGGVEHLDADILLVGQDWGVFDNADGQAILHNIANNTYLTGYLPNNSNPTDNNLCTLFDAIGIDIRSDQKSVFFTNLVLCYRKAGYRISGGFKKTWASNCSNYFLRLVRIIEPKVIICLGKSVFEAVIKAFGEPVPKGSYNRIIESGEKLIHYADKETAVFPMAHCGTFGTNNRNRGYTVTDKLDLQIEDWSRILPYL